MFLVEVSLGAGLDKLLMEYGVVPFKVTHYTKVPDLTFIDTFFPFLTSMFLHGGRT